MISNKNGIRLYKLFTMLLLVLFVFLTKSVCFANEELVKDDFELNSYSLINNVVLYGAYLKKDNEDIQLSIKADDFNLPLNLRNYAEDIRFRVTYVSDSHEVRDCKVINYHTGKVIEDLSEENINKLFNIEYGKNITEKKWKEKIKLSEIEENEIYKYTADSTIQFPEIENDIGKNCIVYIKEKYDEVYEKEINMYKKLSAKSIHITYNEYVAEESFNIMYKTIENDELLKIIKKDEIIYLSEYKDGDKIEYSSGTKYIYNNTDKNITINIKYTFFGDEISDSITIEKDKIYGFDDWKIDSATVSFLENNKNENTNNGDSINKGQQTNKDNNNYQIEQTKEDSKKNSAETQNNNTNNNNNNNNTFTKVNESDASKIVNSKLPKAGLSNSIGFWIFGIIIISIVFYKKYNEYKDK